MQSSLYLTLKCTADPGTTLEAGFASFFAIFYLVLIEVNLIPCLHLNDERLLSSS